MQISHSVTIAAPAEHLWALTIDVESWPQHTSTITSIERLTDGPLRPGSTARVKQPRQRPKIWTVIDIEPQRCFAWSTRALGTTMIGTHTLQPHDATTTNTLTLDITGRLAPIVGMLTRRVLNRALSIENAGFKAAAEGHASS